MARLTKLEKEAVYRAVAIFSDVDNVRGLTIHHIFGHDDIPAYSSVRPEDCELCKNGVKIDAIVNSFGYSALA